MQLYITDETDEKYRTSLDVQGHGGTTEREFGNNGILRKVPSRFYDFMVDKIPGIIQTINSKPHIKYLNGEKKARSVNAEDTVHFPRTQTGWTLAKNMHSLMTNKLPPLRKSTPSFTELWQEVWEAVHEGEHDKTQVMRFSDSIAPPDETSGSTTGAPLHRDRTVDNYRGAIIPPPIENPSQPVLSFERLVTDVERAATEDIDLQAVLTSMPPMAVTKKSRWIQFASLTMIFVVFPAVLALIVSTPSPSQDRLHPAAASFAKPALPSLSIAVPLAQEHQKLTKKLLASAVDMPHAKIGVNDSAAGAILKTPGKRPPTGRVSLNRYSSRTTRAAGGAKLPTTKSRLNPQPGKTTVEDLLVGKPLPALPSRPSVASAMNRIASQMSRCGLNGSGRMVVRVSFSGATGQVVAAQVVGNTFHGTAASHQCVLRTVRRARLPMFKKNILSIKYPFDL